MWMWTSPVQFRRKRKKGRPEATACPKGRYSKGDTQLFDAECFARASRDDLLDLRVAGVFRLNQELAVFHLEYLGQGFYAVAAVATGLIIPYDFHMRSSDVAEGRLPHGGGKPGGIIEQRVAQTYWGKSFRNQGILRIGNQASGSYMSCLMRCRLAISSSIEGSSFRARWMASLVAS